MMNINSVERMIIHIMFNVKVDICKAIRELRVHRRFCNVNDIPLLRDLFVEETITNAEYLIDKNFEKEATTVPQAKLL